MKPEIPNINNNVSSSVDGSNALDLDNGVSNLDNIIPFPTSNNDTLENGKKINENGEIEDKATKKVLRSSARAAAAYFSGGKSESSGIASKVSELKPVDQALGVVSDSVEKMPGVKEVAEELDNAGIADGVNDALNLVNDVQNGDIKKGIDDGKKVLKDSKKMEQYTIKRFAVPILAACGVFFLFSIIFAIVTGPVLGGFLGLTSDSNDYVLNGSNGDGVQNNEKYSEDVSALLSEIPNFNSLSQKRKNILAAAAIPIVNKMTYSWGGHPTGAGINGIPTAGLDCAGYVEWALWTGLGNYPGYLTTAEISNQIGKKFIQIDSSELKPGDIGLKRRGGSVEGNTNHTGIYAGNGQWFHAASTKSGIIRSNYSNFTIYLRYYEVD